MLDLHGKPKNWETSAPLYMEALADIPHELLASAVRYAITSNPYFPKPADLRLSIADELTAWRHKREAGRLARLPPPPEPPPVSEEERAEVAALVQQALQGIAGRRDHLQRDEYRGERSKMLFLDEGDPRRQVWEACESPIEKLLCHALFAWLACKAIPGEFRRSRLSEMEPGAYLFSQQKAARYRLDFLLVAVTETEGANWVAIECDGRRFHMTSEHVKADQSRDQALANIGIPTMRFTGSELHGDMRISIQRIADWLNENGVQTEPDYAGGELGELLAAATPDRAGRRRERDEYWEAGGS